MQVRDGKLLDEMTVSISGLANKVGWADVCHAAPRKTSLRSEEQQLWCKTSGSLSPDVQILQRQSHPVYIFVTPPTGRLVLLQWWMYNEQF